MAAMAKTPSWSRGRTRPRTPVRPLWITGRRGCDDSGYQHAATDDSDDLPCRNAVKIGLPKQRARTGRSGVGVGRSLLVAGSHLPPELDHLFLKVDHSLGAHGRQSNEFHDYGPYPAMAGEGFVELREPVVEFPSDDGFGIERYSPHFAERREVGCFFGIGLHLASVGPLPRPVGPIRPSLVLLDAGREGITQCLSERHPALATGKRR
jgi:hypothetical protein